MCAEISIVATCYPGKVLSFPGATGSLFVLPSLPSRAWVRQLQVLIVRAYDIPDSGLGTIIWIFTITLWGGYYHLHFISKKSKPRRLNKSPLVIYLLSGRTKISTWDFQLWATGQTFVAIWEISYWPSFHVSINAVEKCLEFPSSLG